MQEYTHKYRNPYLGGMLLGLLLIAAYVVLGTGLGASGGLARIAAGLEGVVARTHVLESDYFGAWGDAPMHYYLVFMLIGIVLGGGASAVISKRFKGEVEKGAGVTTRRRLLLVLAGGLLVGFASRLARGCTSGQALSGGALLLTGSFIFTAMLFLTGYAVARLFKGYWND